MHVGESRGDTVKRKNPDGTTANVPCPPLLPDYQQYMWGVDRGDQLIGCYNIGRSKKWWKKVFSYIIECSLLNAYILARYAQPTLHDPPLRGRKKRDFINFCLDVAEQLIGSFHFRQRSGQPPRAESAPPMRLNKNRPHYPIQETKKLECVVCSAKHVKQHLSRSEMQYESRIQCSYCNVHLCISKDRECFSKYHTMECYWT